MRRGSEGDGNGFAFKKLVPVLQPVPDGTVWLLQIKLRIEEKKLCSR